MRCRFSKGVFVVGMLATLLGGAPSASAQSGDMQPLIDRINRLEQDIRTLNIQLSRGGTPAGKDFVPLSSGPAATHLEVRLTELEEELRAATGKAEEISHQIDQVSRRLDKLIGDVDYRLSSLEKARGTQGEMAPSDANQALPPPKVTAAPSPPSVQTGETPGTLGASAGSNVKTAPPPTPPASAPPAAKSPPKGTPQERYDHAFDLLRQSKYDEAATALREFLETSGDDPLASNAHYWLGETYYVREDFRSAAQIFIEGYQKYPKSAKAPDTLLKLGMALAKIDKKSEACATFAKLLTDFPKMSDTLGKRVAKERQGNGCK